MFETARNSCTDTMSEHLKRLEFKLTIRFAVMLTASFGFLALIHLHHAKSADIRGTVSHVVDGDTFDLMTSGVTERIRVCGIDSPEEGEDGYQDAKRTLRKLIAGKRVRCMRIGEGTVCDGRSRKKNRGRTIAQCFIGQDDIAALMIRAKQACDYPKFSGGHYQRIGVDAVCVRKR